MRKSNMRTNRYTNKQNRGEEHDSTFSYRRAIEFFPKIEDDFVGYVIYIAGHDLVVGRRAMRPSPFALRGRSFLLVKLQRHAERHNIERCRNLNVFPINRNESSIDRVLLSIELLRILVIQDGSILFQMEKKWK
jgi:hypothetical protein